MPISNDKKERIAEVVIKMLKSRFESFPLDSSGNRNAPFHQAFLNAFSEKFDGRVTDIPFFISLSSWLHGFNTTMGQSFFESVAHILSDGYKKEFTSGRSSGTLQVTTQQKNAVNSIITKLSNNENTPCLEGENALLFIPDEGFTLTNAIDFSADVFIDTDEKITAIELKSVKPNGGEMRGEKEKILEGKAALYRRYPGKNIEFYIGFPFDPTNDPSDPTGSDKRRFADSIINMNKYFNPNEVLLAAELWDHLSGESSTMEELLNIINSIATPSFLENYSYLSENTNRNNVEYRDLLRIWYLESEIEILEHEGDILARMSTNSRIQKIYNQPIFKSNYCYNRDRYTFLKNTLR
jgi:hypothetical protein